MAHISMITIPPFNKNDPTLWFIQLEGQFELYEISEDKKKFAIVQGNLPTATACEVRDILERPPETNKYVFLKQELIKRLSRSQEEKTRQLLEAEELGDRKPSQFLRYLKSLASQSIGEDFLRTIWLDRLPKEARSILATLRSATLEQVAETADEVVQTLRSGKRERHIAAVAAPPPTMQEQMAELTAAVASLSRRLEEKEKDGYYRDRRRDTSRSRARSKSRSRNTKYCWFHNRFGEKARRCTSPCEFTRKEKN